LLLPHLLDSCWRLGSTRRRKTSFASRIEAPTHRAAFSMSPSGAVMRMRLPVTTGLVMTNDGEPDFGTPE
jgi:hypothetical protein